MIQTHTASLKLHDDDIKSLGVSHIVAASVKCAEGLRDGVDFVVDYERGTVRRLREFGRELYTFTMQYDDRAEERAAEEKRVAETEARATEARALWDGYEALRGKTPAEMIAIMQKQADAWATLADARKDLREWLPRMAALLAWGVRHG